MVMKYGKLNALEVRVALGAILPLAPAANVNTGGELPVLAT